MIDVGDYVSCPVCGGKARVVPVSRDGKQCVVKCPQRHTYGLKSAKGLCFLVDHSEVTACAVKYGPDDIGQKKKARAKKGL